MSNDESHTLLKTIQQWVIAAVIILMPIFFLPITADFYAVNKQTLLLAGVAVLTVLWVIEIFVTKSFSVRKTKYTLPLVLFLLVSIASVYFASINKMEAWLTPLGAGSLLLLTAFYWFLAQQGEQGRKIISVALIASGTLLSFIVFQQFIGVSSALSKAAFLKNPSWTPTGASFSTFLYLLGIIIYTVPSLYAVYKTNKTVHLALYTFALIVMLLGTGVTVYQLFISSKPVFLPQTTGWYIALESLKEKVFLGYGAENFITAFTRTRPAQFNLTDFWNLRFVVSSNLYFHLWTTFGLIGLSTFLFFVVQAVLSLRHKSVAALKYQVPLVVLLTVAFLFPPAFLLLFLIYVFAGLSSGHYEQKTFEVESITSRLLFIAPVLLVVYAVFTASRVYSSELAYRRSLNAIAKNEAGQTYEQHRQAIQLAPWNDQYRISYAQISLAIAKSIAQKPDMTDQDRTTLSQLIQQSIAEAKNAVVLNGTRVTNWENLAGIYKQLMNVAQKADQWSVATYSQATALDPLNPLLRIELGGIFYARKNFPEAIRQFETAVRLKPDFANARYNLAAGYRENKEYQKAVQQMEVVLQLVKPDSADASKAKTEIEQLKALVTNPNTTTTTEETPGETINTPEVGEETEVNPPLDLPDTNAPPEASESGSRPSPTPVSSPVASPEASTSPAPSASPEN